MTSDLRKNIARNMRYAQMNDMLDAQIRQLQSSNSPEAQMQINNLKQQRDANYRQMQQPMSAQEYAEYDDYGRYLGNQASQYQPRYVPSQQQPENDLKQMALDSANHFIQGGTLGWSDEAYGIARGAYDTARTWLNDESNDDNYKDIFKKNYIQYRDSARQELENGYQRNPVISAGSEIAGAVFSPVKIHKPRGYTGMFGRRISHPEDIVRSRFINSVGTGVINGIGYTDENTPLEYAKNIAKSAGTNIGGTFSGNVLFGGGNNLDMYKVGRGVMNGITQSIPHTYNYFIEDEDDK